MNAFDYCHDCYLSGSVIGCRCPDDFGDDQYAEFDLTTVSPAETFAKFSLQMLIRATMRIFARPQKIVGNVDGVLQCYDYPGSPAI